jgi:carbon monoxide dehydrogenase subunit G
MARRTAETVSEIRIEKTPEEVYRFVTTPSNWVGTHPVTDAVTGASGSSEGVGASWTEIIRSPFGRFSARWEVRDANPPHTWTIRTEGFGHTSAVVTIAYTFTAEGMGTRFRRRMTTLLPRGLLGLILTPVYRASRIHEEYLRAVKKRLEG